MSGVSACVASEDSGRQCTCVARVLDHARDEQKHKVLRQQPDQRRAERVDGKQRSESPALPPYALPARGRTFARGPGPRPPHSSPCRRRARRPDLHRQTDALRRSSSSSSSSHQQHQQQHHQEQQQQQQQWASCAAPESQRSPVLLRERTAVTLRARAREASCGAEASLVRRNIGRNQ
jgi:hypothetical protein